MDCTPPNIFIIPDGSIVQWHEGDRQYLRVRPTMISPLVAADMCRLQPLGPHRLHLGRRSVPAAQGVAVQATEAAMSAAAEPLLAGVERDNGRPNLVAEFTAMAATTDPAKLAGLIGDAALERAYELDA